MRRLGVVMSTAAASLLLAPPAPALAHGLVGRQDLPLPRWLFAWGATLVLVLSFVALATLWRSPQLTGGHVRRLGRLPRALEPACGVLGVVTFVFLVYAGLAGSQNPTENLLPTFVYVLLWVGVPVASVLLGDVFRPFNPWRAVGRGVAWAGTRVLGGPAPPPLRYPDRLGLWPAVIGLVAFGWLELVAADGDDPSTMAILALFYAAVQWTGMALFGVERWTERGDGFSVYFGLFARLAPVDVQAGHVVLRRPLSGLSTPAWPSGAVALLCAAIGITAFDGAAEGQVWLNAADGLQSVFESVGFALDTALTLSFTTGLILAVLLIAAVYWIGVLGIRTVARDRSRAQLARTFTFSLAPIAFAYVLAHYFSLLVFQGQAVASLVSDPLGTGADVFGTAAATIDYTALSANATWYVQVGALVVGHAAALAVAHDRALVLLGDSRQATRSQLWMLGVMVAFTCLGLFLLSAGNA